MQHEIDEWPPSTTSSSKPVSAISGRALDREVPNTPLSLSISSHSQRSPLSVVSTVDSLTFHPEPDVVAPPGVCAPSDTVPSNDRSTNQLKFPEEDELTQIMADTLSDTQLLNMLE